MTSQVLKFVQRCALRTFIGPHDHIILAFITSHIPASLLKTDLVIDSGDPGFVSTGLRVSSTLQLHRLMTVTKSMLQRELGTLSPPMQAQVQERLHKLFWLELVGFNTIKSSCQNLKRRPVFFDIALVSADGFGAVVYRDCGHGELTWVCSFFGGGLILVLCVGVVVIQLGILLVNTG